VHQIKTNERGQKAPGARERLAKFRQSSARIGLCQTDRHNGNGNIPMGTKQYHEPAEELSQKTRTFARMITALVEEAEAIGWYEQRISLEKNAVARAIMKDAQKEEFKHFSMDLEFLLRHKADWRKILKGVVLVPGNIVKNAEKAEKAAD